VIDGQLRDSIAASMHTGHELPPEPLLHSPEVIHELERDAARNQHIRAARVMDGNVEDQLIQEIEEPGKRPADECVGTVHSPTQDDIAALTRIPELLEIPGVALPIGVQAEEIIGVQHVHTVADGARVSSPFAGKIQAQGQLLREASQDVLSVVSAAVFADDEPHVDSRGQFLEDLPNGGFDTLAFVVNRQENFHVGRMTRRRTFSGCR
jgi:hypothetical protein